MKFEDEVNLVQFYTGICDTWSVTGREYLFKFRRLSVIERLMGQIGEYSVKSVPRRPIKSTEKG